MSEKLKKQIILQLIQIVYIVSLFNTIQGKEFVEVNVIPEIQFLVDQNQVNSASNLLSFQLNEVQNFYSTNLSIPSRLNNSSLLQQDNNSNGKNVFSNQTNKDLNSKDSKDQQCVLNMEGGQFEVVDSFDIYSYIISNVLQISRSESEYYYFYLDSDLQLYTYRVNTKREGVKFLGYKKIEFEDFILSSIEPSKLKRNLHIDEQDNQANIEKNEKIQKVRENQEQDQNNDDRKKQEQRIRIEQQIKNMRKSHLNHNREKQESFLRHLKQDDDNQQQRGQQITYLKLLSWKDQILCILNSTLYVILQDKGYKIAKIDNLLDADVVDDFLYVALGQEGLGVYEFQQIIGGASQTVKDITIKKVTSLKWNDQYVRQVQAVKDRVFFTNKDSIYIYSLQGRQLNYGCMISESQLSPNRQIEKIYTYSNTILVITELKSNLNNTEKQKGYQEYFLDQQVINANIKSDQKDQGDYTIENKGQCFYKIKEEIDLANDIKDIQIDNQFMYFGIQNGIHGVALGIKQEYLKQLPKNKWTNNFIPKISRIRKIENTSYFLVLTSNRVYLYNLQSFNLTMVCRKDKLFDQNGNLINLQSDDNAHSNQIEYQSLFITNKCSNELTKDNRIINKIEMDFSLFKELLNIDQSIQLEELDILKDKSTCIIQQSIFIKQNQSHSAQSHSFVTGILVSIASFALIYFIFAYYQKRKLESQNLQDRLNKKKKINRTTSSQKSSSEDSGLFNGANLSKSNSLNSQKKDNLNNNSSACILAPNKTTKNQSGIFEEINNNQSINEHSFNNQNQVILNNKYQQQMQQQQQSNKQNQKDQQYQQQLDQQTQQMLYINQQEQYQFIQQILQNQQFQQLSKYEQDRFLQQQYQQHLEYQKQIRMQQAKQNNRGHGNKIVSPIQRKYGGGVDPILETDSDKKMSTRRDQEAFYRMKKRNNQFEENLQRSYQKNINVINDLNLNIQLEDNVQPPNHNIFSPQNFGKFEIDVGQNQGEDQGLSHQQGEQQINEFYNEDEEQQEPSDKLQIQNPQIAFMTLQSIQNSLKNKQQTSNNNNEKKKQKKIPKKDFQNSNYQMYEDEIEPDENDVQNQQQVEQDHNNTDNNIVTQEETEQNKINIELENKSNNKTSKQKHLSYNDYEFKTNESQPVSGKMTRSNNDTTSTASSRKQKSIQQNNVQHQNNTTSNNNTQEPQLVHEGEEDNDNEDNCNSINDEESNQGEKHLNNNKNNNHSQHTQESQ